MKGVVSIGNEAFMYCDTMNSLIAPDSLSEIGSKLLDGCSRKLVVTCPEGSAMDSYVQRTYPNLKVIQK